MMTRLRTALRAFPHASKGVAAVEFALILPVMLVLYLGTLEVSDLIAVDRRVSVISGTMGDLVARNDGDITTARLSDYFKAAGGIIIPYQPAPLRQVVTVLQVAANGSATVRWSCGFNGGTALATDSSYVLEPAMREIGKSNYVVMSTSSYAYRPLLGQVITTAVGLDRTSFYLPRYGEYIGRNGSCPTT